MSTIIRRPKLTPLRMASVALLALLLAGAVIAALQARDEADLASRQESAGDPAVGGPVPQSDLRSQPFPAKADESALMERRAAGGGGVAASSLDGPGGASSFVVPGAERVVRTAEIGIEVRAGGLDGAFDRVAAIAAAQGGFVASSNTSTYTAEPAGDLPLHEGGKAGAIRPPEGGDARSAYLTLRVPADRFDAARQALAGLGDVRSQSIRGEDVSGQLVDFDARLRSLGAQEEALRTLLGRAGGVGEVLQVQSQLFSVRQQIEQLEAQRADLDQRASLSTISVSLFEPGAGFSPPRPMTGLAGSFRKAVDGALAVIGGMIVAVGWLLPPVTLALVVWGILRLRRRSTPRQSTGEGPERSVPTAS